MNPFVCAIQWPTQYFPILNKNILCFAGGHISKGSTEARVFVAGSMTHWKSHEMHRPTGETDFITIIDCEEGMVGLWIQELFYLRGNATLSSKIG